MPVTCSRAGHGSSKINKGAPLEWNGKELNHFRTQHRFISLNWVDLNMAPVAALRKFIKEPIQYGVLSRFIDFPTPVSFGHFITCMCIHIFCNRAIYYAEYRIIFSKNFLCRNGSRLLGSTDSIQISGTKGAFWTKGVHFLYSWAGRH